MSAGADNRVQTQRLEFCLGPFGLGAAGKWSDMHACLGIRFDARSSKFLLQFNGILRVAEYSELHHKSLGCLIRLGRRHGLGGWV